MVFLIAFGGAWRNSDSEMRAFRPGGVFDKRKIYAQVSRCHGNNGREASDLDHRCSAKLEVRRPVQLFRRSSRRNRLSSELQI